MKTVYTLLAVLLLHCDPSALRAEDAGEAKCAMCEKMKKKAARAPAKAPEWTEIDKLVAEMNASTGTAKIEAMAALLNRLARRQKIQHAAPSTGAPPAAEAHQH